MKLTITSKKNKLRDNRLFNNTEFQDQYEVYHYPMRFISQITSPSIQNFENMSLKEIDLLSRENLFTLSEMAHFVRCIPYHKLTENFNIWSSPDYFLTIRKGSVVDHAILMACMFNGTIFESFSDLEDFK